MVLGVGGFLHGTAPKKWLISEADDKFLKLGRFYFSKDGNSLRSLGLSTSKNDSI